MQAVPGVKLGAGAANKAGGTYPFNLASGGSVWEEV